MASQVHWFVVYRQSNPRILPIIFITRLSAGSGLGLAADTLFAFTFGFPVTAL